jgi:hypothetical protein
VYDLRGQAGTHAVQRVTTRIRVFCGEHPLAEYRGSYAEYFRFAADGSLGRVGGEPVLDIHDFDLRRDGWCAMSLRRLTREFALRDARRRLCARSGGLRVECEKSCLLGPGQVEDVQPVRRTDDGGEFGFLAEGPGPCQATLQLSCCGGGERQEVPLSSAVPAGLPASGRGRFAGQQGWAARERFTYTFALQRGDLDGATDYVEADLNDSMR